MDEKLKLINESLEKSAIKYEGTFLLNNLIRLGYVSQRVYDIGISNKYEDVGGDFEEKTSVLDSIDLINEYFDNYGLESYKEKFNDAIKNGVIDVKVPDDDNPYYRSYCGIDKNDHIFAQVEDLCDYNFPSFLIHEFMHTLNANYSNESYYRHSMVTEFISIYFEMSFQNFMLDKGYNKNDIRKLKMERFTDTFIASRIFLNIAPLMEMYLNTGEVSYDNFLFLNKFPSARINTKEEFDDCINFNYKSMKDSDGCFENSSKYILGTIFADYLIKNDSSAMKKVVYLNDNINKDKFNVMDYMEQIGLPMNDITVKEVINSYNDSIKEFCTVEEKSSKKK